MKLNSRDAGYYMRYRIMKEMGWIYQEYQQTPAAIIEQVWVFLNTDIKIHNDLMKESR